MRRGKLHGLSGGPFVRQAGWAGGGGGGDLRGWFVLEKIYTCTKLIFS